MIFLFFLSRFLHNYTDCRLISTVTGSSTTSPPDVVFVVVSGVKGLGSRPKPCCVVAHNVSDSVIILTICGMSVFEPSGNFCVFPPSLFPNPNPVPTPTIGYFSFVTGANPPATEFRLKGAQRLGHLGGGIRRTCVLL